MASCSPFSLLPRQKRQLQATLTKAHPFCETFVGILPCSVGCCSFDLFTGVFLVSCGYSLFGVSLKCTMVFDATVSSILLSLLLWSHLLSMFMK